MDTEIAEARPGQQRTAARSVTPRRPRWWQRPWIAPLMVGSVAFLAFSLPPYLTFDPAQSRLPLREGFAPHYPMLVAHILFGTVALLTCCLQVWPWFRQRHPVAHRIVGRVYVFAGMIPTALTGLVVALAAVTSGVAGKVGNSLLVVVWVAVTFAGFRAARQRRFGEHRRWMIRGFALMTSIVVNRLWVVLCIAALQPFAATYFGGDEVAMNQAAVDTAIWLSWVVNLLIAEWWLERRKKPRGGAPAANRRSAVAASA
ncbi:hypothetical protein GCM10012275_49550 [Longimycelium tulufanense]|uniref:DUF2306 domain-containing protein n=1 Tax=Longimycelium tulufanense TaxID=907463 RepID=A0A8J3CC94_9PSEU|nr:DUF2306 domain-containing protein [Longimycelium tulufanense]GGM72986.1 hypothetical protein GCM10012275_49550 [Longimycelium tulufanense]